MLQAAIRSQPTPQAAGAARLGAAYVALASLRIRCRSTVDRLANAQTLGPEVSVDKVMLGSTEHKVNDAMAQLNPYQFLAGDRAHDRDLRAEWLYSRAATVYGGAVEIQRNIIAEHILKLPSEARHG